MSWEKKKLGDLIDLYDNIRIPLSAIEREKRQGEYPYYGAQSIIDYVNEYLFDGNYILIAEDGENLRKRSQPIAFAVSGQFWVNNHAHIVKGKSDIADDLFIKYFLNNIDINPYVTGAAQPKLSQRNLKEIAIIAPPLNTQRKIASILSAYDDLIETNLKRIKLLEEQAFLKYKGIVRSEKMVTEIKLNEIIQTVKRKNKILKSDYKKAGEFPIIDQSTDFIGGYTNEKETVYEEIPMIVFGDHTRILKYINFPFACGADGTQLVKPKNPNISTAYLYFELISCNLSNYHYARHFKFLKEQVIKLPSEKVMMAFKDDTDVIFNLIQVLRLQNTKLREARDILLPKLMNGQIEV